MENLPMLGKQPMLKRLRRRLRHPDMYHWLALVQAILTPESFHSKQNRHCYFMRTANLKAS